MSVIETADGGFAVAGYTTLPIAGERYFIFKTSPVPPATPPTASSQNLTSPQPLEAAAIIAGLLVAVVGLVIIVITKKRSKRTND